MGEAGERVEALRGMGGGIGGGSGSGLPVTCTVAAMPDAATCFALHP